MGLRHPYYLKLLLIKTNPVYSFWPLLLIWFSAVLLYNHLSYARIYHQANVFVVVLFHWAVGLAIKAFWLHLSSHTTGPPYAGESSRPHGTAGRGTADHDRYISVSFLTHATYHFFQTRRNRSHWVHNVSCSPPSLFHDLFGWHHNSPYLDDVIIIAFHDGSFHDILSDVVTSPLTVASSTCQLSRNHQRSLVR